MKILKCLQFKFNSKHNLFSELEHLQERPHGHNYYLILRFNSEIEKVKTVFKEIETCMVSELNHKDLNSLFGQPTGEAITLWFKQKILENERLVKEIQLDSLELRETDKNRFFVRFD